MRSARSLIARRPRSAARWPIMLAAVVLSVAGCVSMPNGGPPLPLEATHSAAQVITGGSFSTWQFVTTLQSGEISLYAGEREVVLRDPALAARLFHAVK